MLGRSSTGCVSDTIYKTVTEDPPWEFFNLSDSTLCEGGSTVLKVAGALNYHWSNDALTDSITVTSPGTYTVTGENLRGCEKTNVIRVTKYPLPDAGFKMSPAVLDNRHNQLTCQSESLPGASYEWDMGDGMQETGAIVQHNYNISNKITDYTISLNVKSKYDCINNSSAVVDVVPFAPNVFTPNGDGINDLFMPDLELQIMDRNGFLLYSGTSGWDGTYKGKPMDPDTYFYLFRYGDRQQTEHTKKGYITLVR